MLRFVTVLAAAAALTSGAPNPTNIFEIDITPEEAQKYLNSPPFTEPQLAGRTAVLPLVRYNDPRFRAAEAGPTLGHYWKNGREIENTDDYIEEVYDASQYHGQDGLGAYTYGYKTPESAKVENRVRAGDVTGSYVYKSPGHEDIKVRYWADSQGFHQEDNLPKLVPQPVQETAAVRAARIAHEKAWKEAADANLHPNAHPQSYGNNYDYQPQASEVQQTVYQPDSQREGKAYNQQYQASQQFGQQQNQYQQQNQQYQQQNQQYTTTTEPEPTGPPRGFFYSYNYPVSIIVPKNEAEGGASAGHPVDHDTVSHGGF
ncbi:uncharacterized protein LOC114362996 isoform X1 [Ostrinia furnacalis]|uniref:uncharacterized protein LOC114362996 isoform X1 n=1 Tax=Ostrinia furnacalis TaxID=93504 RepID=UPI0010399423|nr:uncharacterized protein LOC114362996 isoform X1 [Ostrinia furnacalis]